MYSLHQGVGITSHSKYLGFAGKEKFLGTLAYIGLGSGQDQDNGTSFYQHHPEAPYYHDIPTQLVNNLCGLNLAGACLAKNPKAPRAQPTYQLVLACPRILKL